MKNQTDVTLSTLAAQSPLWLFMMTASIIEAMAMHPHRITKGMMLSELKRIAKTNEEIAEPT